MTDQLTQRIAAEFVRHDLHLEWVGVDRTANGLLRTYCLCGWKGEPRTAGPANETVVAAALRLDGAVHVAEAVAAALQLRDTVRLLQAAGSWIAGAIGEDPSGEPWLMSRTLLNELFTRVDELGGWPADEVLR